VAVIISPADLERLNQMDAEREKEFDKLLDRMRAAFADVPEEQLIPLALAPATGILAGILAAWRRGLFVVVVFDHLLTEVERTLRNRYFSRRLTQSEVQAYLAYVRSLARHTPITVQVSGVATHPEDDLVLATALSAGADYLVTGDRRFRTRVPTITASFPFVSPTSLLSL
jgi:predicted nucleic acid-binding protein